MKILSFALAFCLILFFPFKGFAEGRRMECRNEAKSPIRANIQIHQAMANIQFGADTDGSELENEVRSKSAKLVLNSEDSSESYLLFEGKVPTTNGNHQLRTVQVRVLAELLQSDEEFHVILNISTRHRKKESANSFWSYAMICK